MRKAPDWAVPRAENEVEITAECLSVCGVIVLPAIAGQRCPASVTYLVIRQATASRDRAFPARAGNTGSSGRPDRSSSQAVRAWTVDGVSGVHRSRRPLP